jgi:hypothetical protein
VELPHTTHSQIAFVNLGSPRPATHFPKHADLNEMLCQQAVPSRGPWEAAGFPREQYSPGLPEGADKGKARGCV